MQRFRRRLYGDEDGAVSDDDQEWGAAAAAGAIAGGTAARAAATGRRGGRGATAAVDSSASEADSEADEEYKPVGARVKCAATWPGGARPCGVSVARGSRGYRRRPARLFPYP